MKRTGLILLISGYWLLVSGFYTNTYAQDTETLTLLTYYPAPYGVYQEVQIQRAWGNFLTLRKTDVTPNTSWLFHTPNPAGSNPSRLEIAYNDGTTTTWGILSILPSGFIGIGTTNPTSILGLNGQAWRTIQVERRTTSGSGSPLTIEAGGAFSGGTDLYGGNLYLRSGISTGDKGSRIQFSTATPGTSGTSDNNPSIKMEILGNGNVGIGIINPSGQLDIGGLTGTTTATTQLHLGGDYNQGPNINTKLLIDRYNNDAQMTILRAIDENNNTDLWVRSAPTQGGRPIMFFRGNLWVGEETGENHRFRSVTPGGIAVFAKSTASYGLWAESEQSAAIYTRTSNQASATIEASHTNGGRAVQGISSQTGGTGIYGSGEQWAGYFNGRVTATQTDIELSYPNQHDGHFYDVAELIPCAKDVEYGDVVVINPEKDRETIRCTNENQSAAGIISENPQLSFGDREKAREEAPEKNWNFLALAGQVYVKVDATFGEIKRGDLLSLSSTPGHAIKARPIGEINGHPIYPQGCIVGKALEPLKEGRGKIQALVCLM